MDDRYVIRGATPADYDAWTPTKWMYASSAHMRFDRTLTPAPPLPP